MEIPSKSKFENDMEKMQQFHGENLSYRLVFRISSS